MCQLPPAPASAATAVLPAGNTAQDLAHSSGRERQLCRGRRALCGCACEQACFQLSTGTASAGRQAAGTAQTQHRHRQRRHAGNRHCVNAAQAAPAQATEKAGHVIRAAAAASVCWIAALSLTPTCRPTPHTGVRCTAHVHAAHDAGVPASCGLGAACSESSVLCCSLGTQGRAAATHDMHSAAAACQEQF